MRSTLNATEDVRSTDKIAIFCTVNTSCIVRKWPLVGSKKLLLKSKMSQFTGFRSTSRWKNNYSGIWDFGFGTQFLDKKITSKIWFFLVFNKIIRKIEKFFSWFALEKVTLIHCFILRQLTFYFNFRSMLFISHDSSAILFPFMKRLNSQTSHRIYVKNEQFNHNSLRYHNTFMSATHYDNKFMVTEFFTLGFFVNGM